MISQTKINPMSYNVPNCVNCKIYKYKVNVYTIAIIMWIGCSISAQQSDPNPAWASIKYKHFFCRNCTGPWWCWGWSSLLQIFSLSNSTLELCSLMPAYLVSNRTSINIIIVYLFVFNDIDSFIGLLIHN